MIFLVGTNLRLESPLLNSRIRKNIVLNGIAIAAFSFGLGLNYLSYEINNLGHGLLDYKNFLVGKLYYLKNIFMGHFF
jgi:hypothetical protein